MTTTGPGSKAPRSAHHGRTSDLWYLCFLASLVFQPLFDPETGAVAWVAAGVSAGLFVPLYLWNVSGRGGWTMRWATELTVLLGAATIPFNGGATVYLIYAAAFAAQRRRRVAHVWWTVLSLALLVMAAFVPLPLPLAFAVFGFPALLVWVVGLMVRQESERDQASEQLRIDNARIEHLATATERERLARDLHDALGQSLTEIVVRAQLVRRLAASDPGRAADEAAMIEGASRRALDEVRAAVRGWREVRLDDELAVAEHTLAAAGIVLTVDRDPVFDPPPTTETAVALALREAVTNVVRHAGAERCIVTLRRDAGQDVLEVADDGRGGDIAEGSGLAGMRERILALGGEVAYTTRDGTTVTVRVPAGVPA